MPDLSEQLSAILQNPEAQKNIQNLLSSLQGGSPPESPPPDFSQMFSPPPPKTEDPFSGIDINSLMKIQQIFSKMSCSDENINLLRALRPHLHKPEKVDEAINILRLMSILPALGESGVFGGIFR
ncbi:MAG: hypothetical protein IKU42_03735 [Oscillospiraceae bacterium]|nr:hypothetical protein [Oscillospiraceae bacterium]